MRHARTASVVAAASGAAVAAIFAACSVNDVSPTNEVDSGTDGAVEAADATADVSSFVDVSDAAPPPDVIQDAGLDVGSGFVSISGWDHACAVMGDGGVACWGNNNYGQSNPSNDAGVLYAPEYVKGLSGATQVSVTLRFSCAVLGNGTAKCWGLFVNGNWNLQTIQGADGGVLGGIEKVDVGFGSAGPIVVVKTKTGDPLCFGGNDLGACSNGGSAVTTTASPMLSAPNTPFTNVKDVAVGQSGQACVVSSDGKVHCSGNYPRGDNVVGTIKLASTAQVNASTDFTGAGEINLSYQHACAIQASDRSIVNCWGANFTGQLGVPIANGYPPYVEANVGGLTGKVLNVSTGDQHTCVALDDGTARCWGAGGAGQLGQGSKSSSATSVAVANLPSGKKVRFVEAAGSFSCATMTDGTAYCWGKGDTGQLGDGQGKQSDTPVQVMAPQ